MVTLLVFCEASADSETVKGLVERVLREEGPQWLRDLLEGAADDVVRQIYDWVPDGEGRTFFDLHKLASYASRLRIRVPQGHFSGAPGAPGALMARTAFRVARELELKGEKIDAVLLVWDMDDQGEGRRQGLRQARDEARELVPFVLLLGCADPMREAWVLAGFEPKTDEERTRLEALRQELGFNPCEEAHRLDAKKEQAKRSPKRVLEALTAGDHDRKKLCWTEAPLVLLRNRGQGSGLVSFLDEATAGLVPLFTGVPTEGPQRK
jgi:hypothetical protein